MTQEPWLNEQELAAWVRLVAVMELLPGVLDSQLRQDAQLTHFEYHVLAMLSEAPERTLQMTELAGLTNAALSRLSRAVGRLEEKGLVTRVSGSGDRRARNATLTEAGWATVRETAPGHAITVREHVFAALSPEQATQLEEIAAAVLSRVDPHGTMAATYTRYDRSRRSGEKEPR